MRGVRWPRECQDAEKDEGNSDDIGCDYGVFLPIRFFRHAGHSIKASRPASGANRFLLTTMYAGCRIVGDFLLEAVLRHLLIDPELDVPRRNVHLLNQNVPHRVRIRRREWNGGQAIFLVVLHAEQQRIC